VTLMRSRSSAHLSSYILFLVPCYLVVALSSRAGGRTYLVREVARTANPLSLLHSWPFNRIPIPYDDRRFGLRNVMCDVHEAVFNIIPLLIVPYRLQNIRVAICIRVGRVAYSV